MTEEAKATETSTQELIEQAKDQTLSPGPGLETANIRDNIEEHNVDIVFPSLFSDEDVSESELMGEDDATGEKTDIPESKGETKLSEEELGSEGTKATEGDADQKSESKEGEQNIQEEKPADGQKAETKEGDKESKEDAETGDKKSSPEIEQRLQQKEEQVSGLSVALHQERQTVNDLKAQNQRLLQQIADLNSKSTDAKGKDFEDFEILSDEEYEELLEEDDIAASKYLHKLNRYNAYQNEKQQAKMEAHNAFVQAQASEKAILTEGINALESVIPGMTAPLGKKPPIVNTLVDFASQHGMGEDILAVITNPSTKVLYKDGDKDKTITIGSDSAQIVRFIKSVYDFVSSIPSKEQVEADALAKLRPQVEAEFMEKLKSDSSSGFRSLDMAPGSGDKDTKRILEPQTEKEWASLSDKDEARLLGA